MRASGIAWLFQLIDHSFSNVETLINYSIEESSEEVEPLLLLDFSVVVLVELGKELVNFCLTDVFGKTGAGSGKRDDFRSIDFTVVVDIDLVEGFESGSKCLLSSLCDFLTLFVVKLHIFFLILTKNYSLWHL